MTRPPVVAAAYCKNWGADDGSGVDQARQQRDRIAAGKAGRIGAEVALGAPNSLWHVAQCLSNERAGRGRASPVPARRSLFRRAHLRRASPPAVPARMLPQCCAPGRRSAGSPKQPPPCRSESTGPSAAADRVPVDAFQERPRRGRVDSIRSSADRPSGRPGRRRAASAGPAVIAIVGRARPGRRSPRPARRSGWSPSSTPYGHRAPPRPCRQSASSLSSIRAAVRASRRRSSIAVSTR